jgi:hypothetical protein
MLVYWRLMCLIWLLNAYDAVITAYSISRFRMVETNPIMRVCLELGPFFFILSKIIIITIVLLVLGHRHGKHPKVVRNILIVTLGAFLGICIWNSVATIWVANNL